MLPFVVSPQQASTAHHSVFTVSIGWMALFYCQSRPYHFHRPIPRTSLVSSPNLQRQINIGPWITVLNKFTKEWCGWNVQKLCFVQHFPYTISYIGRTSLTSEKLLSNIYRGLSSLFSDMYRTKYFIFILTEYPSSSSPHLNFWFLYFLDSF